jgi:Putative addiction module component
MDDETSLLQDDSKHQIPQWQMDEVRRRIDEYKNKPDLLIDEETFFKMLGED